MEYPLLLEFLDTRLEAALDQERFNRQTIHLYRCGDSWLALEYSPCLLEEQFHYKDKKPLIFHLRGRKACGDGGSSGLLCKEDRSRT